LLRHACELTGIEIINSSAHLSLHRHAVAIERQLRLPARIVVIVTARLAAHARHITATVERHIINSLSLCLSSVEACAIGWGTLEECDGQSLSIHLNNVSWLIDELSSVVLGEIQGIEEAVAQKGGAK
jgi:hypothetical protein